jgi:hypothetical protein
MRTQATRVIGGRVNLDGTPWTGSGFTSRKTGTGAYTVTFPGARLISFTANPFFGGGGTAAIPNQYTGESVNLSTVTTAGAATDSAFQFTATVAA